MGRARTRTSGAPSTSGRAVLDARGGLVTPGLVDSHTHLVFAGERAGEFALRVPGKSYLDVALRRRHRGDDPRDARRVRRRALRRPPWPRARRLLAQGVHHGRGEERLRPHRRAELRLLRVHPQLAHGSGRELTVVPDLARARRAAGARRRPRRVRRRRSASSSCRRVARERLAGSCRRVRRGGRVHARRGARDPRRGEGARARPAAARRSAHLGRRRRSPPSSARERRPPRADRRRRDRGDGEGGASSRGCCRSRRSSSARSGTPRRGGSSTRASRSRSRRTSTRAAR